MQVADRLRRIQVERSTDRPTSPSEGENVKPKKPSASAAAAASAATAASIATLEAQVAMLLADREDNRAALADAQEEAASLRQTVSALKSELHAVRENVDRVSSDLRTESAQPLAALRNELNALTHESTTMRAQLAMHERALSEARTAQHEHAQQLQDVAILRATQGYIQASSDRTDVAAADLTRQMTEMRAELAALQQRHASLTSGTNAEHNAHRQAFVSVRSASDSMAMQIETLQGAVGGLQANEATASATSEKLKKAARRHELLVQGLKEVHEQRATELRGLVKTVADQLRPLHETSRRHAAQIEEISAGINVLAELLKFTNRNRTQTFADALAP